MKDAKDVLSEHGKRRREFVARAGKATLTAPAVALLLAQTATPALASVSGVKPTIQTTKPVTTM